MRTKAFRRSEREKHIKRKENIIRKYSRDNPPHRYDDSKDFLKIVFSNNKYPLSEGDWIPYWHVNCRGKLNKGKVHCSCGMCMAKTRNKNRRHIHGNYAPSINYKPSDLRKIQKMDLNNFD